MVGMRQLAIGDLATQYFADRDIFCAGRVPEEDLLRTLKAVGGAMQTSVNGLQAAHLGQCALFEERQIGGERCVGRRSTHTCTHTWLHL
jgi:T-complex protein 1 subunit eta